MSSKTKKRPPAIRAAHRRPRLSRSQVKRRKVALVALIVLAILGGLPIVLNQVGGDDNTTTDDSEESETTTTRPPGGVISPDLPQAPALVNEVGIVNDAHMAECSTTPGPVEASGAVMNSGAEAADIVVTVSWVTDRSDVLARGIAVLSDVVPGATSPWSVSDDLDTDQAVTCVLTAKRGTLPG